MSNLQFCFRKRFHNLLWKFENYQFSDFFAVFLFFFFLTLIYFLRCFLALKYLQNVSPFVPVRTLSIPRRKQVHPFFELHSLLVFPESLPTAFVAGVSVPLRFGVDSLAWGDGVRGDVWKSRLFWVLYEMLALARFVTYAFYRCYISHIARLCKSLERNAIKYV